MAGIVGRAMGRTRQAVAALAGLAWLTVVAQAAPLPIPADLVPGQKYQLAFVTSGQTTATSADVSFYNQFVQTAASSVGWGGVSWRAIVSTPSIDARNNAVVGAATPVYNLQLARVADNFADFWDSSHAAAINVSETGVFVVAPAWTGSTAAGVGEAGKTLGNAGVDQMGRSGAPGLTTSQWASLSAAALISPLRVYALSPELTVPSPGDFDGDGDVDGADLLVWQRGFGTTYSASDLASWKSQFGSATSVAASVPEPLSWTLLLTAACGSLFVRSAARLSP